MRHLLAAILFSIIAGCGNRKPAPVPNANLSAGHPLVPVVESIALRQTDSMALRRFQQQHAITRQGFQVRADTSTLVCGKEGLRVWISPQDLEMPDGASVTGAIDVTLIELQRQEDFVRHNMPTSSDGKLLESGGSYFIGLRSCGKELHLKKGHVLSVLLPKLSDRNMELFYGQQTTQGVNWKPANQTIDTLRPADRKLSSRGYPIAVDTIETRMRVPVYYDSILADVEMEIFHDKRPLSVNPRDFPWRLHPVQLQQIGKRKVYTCRRRDTGAVAYENVCLPGPERLTRAFYETVELSSLGWINCDRFVNKPMLALNARFADGATFGNVQTFIVYRDINGVSGRMIGPDAGTTFSLDRVPVDSRFRLIAMTWQDGKPYVFAKDYRLQAETEIVLDLQPVREKDIEAMMKI